MQHTCAIEAGGDVYCWGLNDARQAVGGALIADVGRVAELEGRFVNVTAAGRFSCAVRDDGAVYCWGANDVLQCARDDWPEGVTPTTAGRANTTAHRVDVPPSARVEAGPLGACALTREGEVYCWGGNHRGQTGTGATSEPPLMPTRVPGLQDVVDVSLGEAHGCAVTNDGAVYCWGNNEAGELGIPASSPRAEPVRVWGLPDIIEVSAGASFTCAVDTMSSAWCWGSNSGRLGDGTRSGEVLCWGDNQAGQLGRPEATHLDPGPVPGLPSSLPGP
jgi:alpha-tubulin suppressor-like RCC1 family protein